MFRLANVLLREAGLLVSTCWLAILLPATLVPGATHAIEEAQEQRIDITIQNYEFVLSQPTPIRLGVPTVIILRNQDIVRHGFTSPALPPLYIRTEGEGISAYGKGMEGFYIDPGKTLVLHFTTELSGRYSFQCDLHPQMKGELFLLEVPMA